MVQSILIQTEQNCKNALNSESFKVNWNKRLQSAKVVNREDEI